jgi:hypothetical protein
MGMGRPPLGAVLMTALAVTALLSAAAGQSEPTAAPTPTPGVVAPQTVAEALLNETTILAITPDLSLIKEVSRGHAFVLCYRRRM